MVGLWEHSLGAAAAASIIAKRIGAPEAEEISTAALLHDIGKVILKIKLEEEFKQFESTVREKSISMFEAERASLGTDHAEIGGWLAKNWYLPDKADRADRLPSRRGKIDPTLPQDRYRPSRRCPGEGERVRIQRG